MCSNLNILEFTPTELTLLCLKDNKKELLPLIKKIKFKKERFTIPELKQEIIKYDIKTDLSVFNILKQKLSIKYVFYRPGYCFQKKYHTYWNYGFEYRYARKTSVCTFLWSCQNLSEKKNIHINSDITSYIISFLLPEELGKEIYVRSNNDNITKKKDYIRTVTKINHCRIGHTYKGPYNCKICSKLHSEYMLLDLKLSRINNIEIIEDYILPEEDDTQFTRLKLELDLQNITHNVKLGKLENRAWLRLRQFQNC